MYKVLPGQEFLLRAHPGMKSAHIEVAMRTPDSLTRQRRPHQHERTASRRSFPAVKERKGPTRPTRPTFVTAELESESCRWQRQTHSRRSRPPPLPLSLEGKASCQNKCEWGRGRGKGMAGRLPTKTINCVDHLSPLRASPCATVQREALGDRR